MSSRHCFNYFFLGQHCRLEINSEHVEATTRFERYAELFPAFVDRSGTPAQLTVVIHDLADHAGREVEPAVVAQLRQYLQHSYATIAPEVLDAVCTARYLAAPRARELLEATLDNPNERGISVQKDFLVFSRRNAGQLEAFADVTASVQEAWAYHAMNFFKVFFFAQDTVRLHGSGATHGDAALLLLANTGGGKSTMKNLFLNAVPEPAPFTDDSIMARATTQGFELYQDPVEFLRWCYLPEAQRAEQVIPGVRPPLAAQPSLYYLIKADTTATRPASAAEILTLIKEEAFYQHGYLTQRFITEPQAEALLQRYFDNTLRFLTHARCHVAEVRHNDDYAELFAEFRRQLEVG